MKISLNWLKKFIDIKKELNKGIKKFKHEVILGKYPSKRYSY